jgi:hypothetical protein
VVSSSGPVCLSSNGGGSWQQAANAPGPLWYSVAMSADGNKIIAVLQWLSNGNPVATIYTSTNFATSWVSNNLPQILWGNATISADGRKMFVANNYTNALSTNDGTTWLPGPGGQPASEIISSADGGVLFSCAGGPLAASYSGIYRAATIIQPQLTISSTNSVSLSWTIPSTNFVLKQSPDLVIWSSVTNVPTLNLTNLQDQVTLPLSASNSFFRLATP